MREYSKTLERTHKAELDEKNVQLHQRLKERAMLEKRVALQEMKALQAKREARREQMSMALTELKSVVKKKYYKKIAKLAVVMKKYPDLKIPLEGHTDNVGGLAYNKKLSQRRAGAVKKYLVEKLGIEASHLNAKGYGKIRPIASNATKEGRQKNRRVDAAAEFSIKK